MTIEETIEMQFKKRDLKLEEPLEEYEETDKH